MHMHLQEKERPKTCLRCKLKRPRMKHKEWTIKKLRQDKHQQLLEEKSLIKIFKKDLHGKINGISTTKKCRQHNRNFQIAKS